MNTEITKEIVKRQNEILSSVDEESVAVYLFLKNEYEKGNVGNNKLFQFVFRSYYRLDSAGLGGKLKNRYFQLMAGKQRDLPKILRELYKIKTLKNKNTIQFSFATKLLHTIDNNNPIFDAEVSRVLHVKVSGNTADKKILSCERVYQSIKNTYIDLLRDKDIQKIISKFRKETHTNEDQISDVKILDFIIWKLGKAQK